MCIAVLIPAKKGISDEQLRNCWENNPDGGGYMFVSNNRIVIRKELKKFKRFREMFRKDHKAHGENSPFVLHCRIATHGKIDLKNCHPFRVNRNVAFVHNGIISIPIKKKNASDTSEFNRRILQQLPSGFLKNHAIVHLLHDYTAGSKMIFLTSSGKVTIIHENEGVWDDGVWFSNRTYKYTKCYTIGSTYQYSRFADWYDPDEFNDEHRFRTKRSSDAARSEYSRLPNEEIDDKLYLQCRNCFSVFGESEIVSEDDPCEHCGAGAGYDWFWNEGDGEEPVKLNCSDSDNKDSESLNLFDTEEPTEDEKPEASV